MRRGGVGRAACSLHESVTLPVGIYAFIDGKELGQHVPLQEASCPA